MTFETDSEGRPPSNAQMPGGNVPTCLARGYACPKVVAPEIRGCWALADQYRHERRESAYRRRAGGGESALAELLPG